MPTLLDAEQQGLANEDTSTMAAALGGGITTPKDVPQSDSRVIAERLLGPELAERYGDVLGIRKETWSDFWRDAGNELGRPGNADRVKQRVIDQYAEKYRADRQEAHRKDQEDRLKISSIAELARSTKDMPKKHRVGILKAGLERLQMASSPEVVKMLADDEVDTDSIFSPEMMKLAEEDPQAWLEQASQVFADPQALVALLKGIQGIEQTKADTRRKILQNERSETRDRNALIRQLSDTQITDEATGERRLMTPEEVLKIVDAYYPIKGAAPAGIAQVPPEVAAAVEAPDEMVGGTSTSTPTTSGSAPTTTSTTGPVGIPQTGARKITGTVRRVE